MSKIISIYALCEPSNGAVRYIGRSIHPERRYYQHIFNAHKHPNSKKNSWILRLKESDMRPDIKILEDIDHRQAPLAEKRWVTYYLNRDRCLYNSLTKFNEPKKSTGGRITKENYAKLDSYCDQKGLSRGRVIDLALTEYFDKVKWVEQNEASKSNG